MKAWAGPRALALPGRSMHIMAIGRSGSGLNEPGAFQASFSRSLPCETGALPAGQEAADGRGPGPCQRRAFLLARPGRPPAGDPGQRRRLSPAFTPAHELMRRGTCVPRAGPVKSRTLLPRLHAWLRRDLIPACRFPAGLAADLAGGLVNGLLACAACAAKAPARPAGWAEGIRTAKAARSCAPLVGSAFFQRQP